MPIRIVQLNAEFQLVTDLDAFGLCILQTLGQGLGQGEGARKLIAFDRLVDDLKIVFFIQFMLIGDNGP